VQSASAHAAITLTRTTDGVYVYQNDQGAYSISDVCRPTGTRDDPGTTIGPGYIYRVDLDGHTRVVAPIPSNGPVLNPPTGLGVFIADMYQGDPNNTPYTDKGAVYHAGAGAFESVQGNVCQGDTNNLAFTSGSGVSSGWVDQIGTATAAPDGSYLWVHFMVDLADPYGNQFQVLYEYRFYASEVDLWTKVRPCPDGSCHADARGPAPFLKMPKFELLRQRTGDGLPDRDVLRLVRQRDPDGRADRLPERLDGSRPLRREPPQRHRCLQQLVGSAAVPGDSDLAAGRELRPELRDVPVGVDWHVWLRDRQVGGGRPEPPAPGV
jgi:hypothetical protein